MLVSTSVHCCAQEAMLLAHQLEQHKGRLAVALAARDRADADCAAAKAERAAAERDREAAEKVLAEVVTQLDEMERREDGAAPPADEPPPLAQPSPLLLPHPEVQYIRQPEGELDLIAAAVENGEPTSPAAQRPSRDPRLAAGDVELPEAGSPAGASPEPEPAGGGGAAADDHMPALADSPREAGAPELALAEPAAPSPEPEAQPLPKEKPLPGNM